MMSRVLWVHGTIFNSFHGKIKFESLLLYNNINLVVLFLINSHKFELWKKKKKNSHKFVYVTVKIITSFFSLSSLSFITVINA
jgi:hypothetical protein